ncbi:MAG: metallophosphoesterase [Bacillota bacterium]
MRAGIVSDIHGSFFNLLRAVKSMGNIDLLIHAGDGAADIVKLQGRYSFRIEAVKGNCDSCDIFPEEALFEIDGYRIFLCHGHRYGVKTGIQPLLARARAEKADVAVYGHTHEALICTERGILLINPGSLYYGRAPGGPSYAILETMPDGGLAHYICRIF